MQITHPLYRDYNITVTGKVINNKTGKVKKPSINTYGYLVVTLHDKILKPKQYFVHRLVYEAFVGPIEDGYTIDHKDGNKLHNRIDNLEQVTAVENINRYYRSLPEINRDVSSDTTKLPRTSKLSLEVVKLMICDLRNGMTNAEASNKYGVASKYVSLIRHKKRWIYAWNELGLGSATTNLSGSRAK